MDPVPVQPRRKDGRRERTAKAISGAASTLFYEQGVAKTTIDEIAEAAGVSVGSVYVHFGSKEALYLALVEDAVAINAQYVSDAQPSASPIHRVFNAGDAYVRFALDHPIQFRLISMQTNESGSPEVAVARERITQRVEERVSAIAADMEAAVAAGEVTPVATAYAAKFLWATWTATIGLTMRTERLAIGPSELQTTLDIARDILARGMGYTGDTGGMGHVPQP